LIRLIKNFQLIYIASQGATLYQNVYSVSKNTTAVDILLLKFKVTVCKPHTFKHQTVTGMETKLACIIKGSFFNVPLDYIQNNFLE
jgi:hypothetical protein